MSLILKSIVNADAGARYLSPGELEPIKNFVKSGERRLRLVQVLTENRESIIKQAGNELFQKRPDIISPGGNAFGQEMSATCLRDMDYYLRLITYSVVAGESTPLQEIGVSGAREMYKSLGTPIEAVVESIRAMKSSATSMISEEDANEVGAYFDYLIAGIQ
ncbi:allophycocyanin [aff. Roholtiella sp. LEGE 12411]|uniref:allophycocyanin n=1 Tax=aff. Roholtiella sp. LEGE 12411 TaxID=1828822 RepID=UPI0018809FD3|nr:allophycocyanin [aff. Roholtiella sp. LEGE 12411]MBE9035853.1 allophycocyanin [aff. Roholtiella sp. LEGE 12411]